MFPVVPVGRKPKTLPAFIVAGNGIFLRKESPLGITQTRVSNVAHLPHLAPTLEYKLPPIPKKLSAQIAGFLLKVDKMYHCEGALLLCLDKNMKWRIVVPRQDPSGADVKYFVDDDTVPDGWLLAGTVHSHPFNKTSAPTASWTDEGDERKIDGVHLVAGSLEHEPKYGAAVVVNGTRFKYVKWQELIVPAEADMDAVPDEWFDKIMKNKPGVVTKIVNKVSSYGSSYTYTPDYIPKQGETVEQAIARARKGSFDWINESAGKLGYRLVWSLEEIPDGEVETSGGAQDTQVYDSVTVQPNGQQTECECDLCECGLTKDLRASNGKLICDLCLKNSHGYKKKKHKAKSTTTTTTTVDTPSGPMSIITESDTGISFQELRCPDCSHMWVNHDVAGCTLTNLDCKCDTPIPNAPTTGQITVYDPHAFIEGPIWRDAKPIACEDKHPTTVCPPKGCGCHCKPCREHTVGAYNAADVNGIDDYDIPTNEAFDEWRGNAMGRAPEEDECKCDECEGGCFAYLGLNYEDEGRTICEDCQRGSHYLADGSFGTPQTRSAATK